MCVSPRSIEKIRRESSPNDIPCQWTIESGSAPACKKFVVMFFEY